MSRRYFSIADYMAKTEQLYNVPAGARVYGYTRNIKKPKVKHKKYSDIIEMTKDTHNFEYQGTINVIDNETHKIMNKHKTEIYKKKK